MAKNRLKGLTIEIGGNTTELDKALDKVNKRAGDVSSELGEINRLLKMDPGNMDLLTQKQKVLADAISNSSEKLKTLKEAEKQVQEQFKRGEVSEEQVRALEREVIAATKKLESYENAAKETAEEIENLGKKSKKTEKESGNLGESLKSVAKTGLAAVAAAAAAVVAGLIGAAESTREYRTEMGKLDTAFTTNGHSSESATKAYKELQSVIGETDQAVEAANHLAQLTDNEKDLAQWTGDILPGVFATFGASLPIEGLTEAANETAKVGQVTGPLADALNWAAAEGENFGVTLKENTKENKEWNEAVEAATNAEELFNLALSECTTEQERQALITETLSRLYGDASESYKETNAEVIRANEANEAWMSSLADVGGAIEPIITDVKMLGAGLLSDVVPGVQQLAEAFRGLLSGDAGAADAIGEALSGVITGLLEKVTELAPTLVEVALSLISTLTSSLLSQLPSILQTLMQIASDLILQLSEVLPPLLNQLLTDTIPSLITSLLEYAPQLLQAAITLLQSLVEAIPVVISELLIALPDIISTTISFLMESIPLLLDAATQLLLAIVDAIPVLLQSLVEALPQILDSILNLLLDPDAFSKILDAAFTLCMAIVESIPKIVVELVKALPQIWKTLRSFLLQLPGKIWELLKLVVVKVVDFTRQMITKAREIGSKFRDNIVNYVKELPGKIRETLLNVISKVKDLPSKMVEIGGDLISGLWNGINNKLTWLKNKIKDFTDSVLSSIKNFFGVHSPARSSGSLKTTDWVGEMLNEGLAGGLIESADSPIDAMKRVTSGVLDAAASGIDGLSINRQLNGPTSSQVAAAASGDNLLTKLDRILTAIERGQVLTIDGDALVGATADRYDSQLGMRRALAARGAV